MLDDRAADLARRQFGVIGRHQLIRELGYSEGAVEGLVSRGSLERRHFGVYRVRGSADPPEQAAMAAVLRCWPRARAGGPFVLGLLGVRGFTVHDPFGVLVPPGREVTNVPFPVWEDSDDAADRASFGGLPIVHGARAIIEAVRLLPRDDDAIAAIDAGRWQGLTSIDALVRRAAELGKHPGAARVLAFHDAGALEQESGGERSLAAALEGIGATIEWQVWVAPDIRVDVLIRELGLIIEYLGEADHSGATARARDAERDARLRALGYIVLYVTKHDLRDPAAFAARVRSLCEVLRLRAG